MPIDPSIAMGVRPLEVANPLNQLAQVSQIQAAQRQGEVAQMQLEDLKNDRIEMAAFQRDTGLTTPQAIATLMRNPKTRGQAIELQMKYKQQLQADKFLRDRYPGLPSLFGEEGAAAPAAAPMAAPAAAAQIEPTGAQVGGPIAAPNVMAAPLTAPRNAMVAPTAAPAAAPANALAAPPAQGAASPTGRTRQELEYTIELAKMNPYLAGAGEVAKLELAELNKTQTLAPGTSLYQGGRVTFTAPAAPTTLARLQAEMAALPPGDPRRADYAALIKKETTHPPPSTATATIAAEKTEHVKRAEYLAKEYDDISRAAKLAAKSLPAIEMNLAILDKGFKTGFGEETKIAGARILGALGVKDAENMATDAQVFKANATQAILQKQLEQKGPQTESDAQRISEIGSQIPKTEDANRVLLAIGQAQLKRDINQRAFFDKWWREHKTYDGAEDAWYAGEGGRSLFDSPEIKKQLAKTSIATPTTSAAPAAAPSSIRSQADAILRGGKP